MTLKDGRSTWAAIDQSFEPVYFPDDLVERQIRRAHEQAHAFTL